MRKKSKSIQKIMIIVFILVALLSACNNSNEPANSSKVEYPKINLPQPESDTPPLDIEYVIETKASIPKQVNIYSINNPKISEEKIKDKFKEIKAFSSENGQDFSDKTVSIDINTTNGYWTCVNKDIQDALFDSTQKTELSEDDCIKLGKEIAEVFNVDLSTFTDISVTPIQYEPSVGEAVTVGNTIYFKPIIDGFKVYGVSRFYVDLDGYGNVASIGNCSKSCSMHSETEIISIEEGIERIKKGEGSVVGNTDIEQVVITNCEVMYFDDPSSTEELPYLQPILQFTGEGINKDGERTAYGAVVPAIKQY